VEFIGIIEDSTKPNLGKHPPPRKGKTGFAAARDAFMPALDQHPNQAVAIKFNQQYLTYLADTAGKAGLFVAIAAQTGRI